MEPEPARSRRSDLDRDLLGHGLRASRPSL